MVTPAIYNGFTFDGVDSKQYGVFITDVKVFGAPVRDVESVSIPGRNGDLLIDHGRYENIDVVYSAVIHDIENFTTIMANFRAALASKIGYKRLSDDINIGEYRLATFKDGLDVSTLNKKTGQFDITFNCKPQRYFLEGETPRLLVQNMVPSTTKTETGSIVSIESDGGDKVTSLVAQIEPIQAGSGDPSPTNVRPITGWTGCNVMVSGKNLIPQTERVVTSNGVTFNVMSDGTIYTSGTATALVVFGVLYSLNKVLKVGERYILNGCEGGAYGSTYGFRIANPQGSTKVQCVNGDVAFTYGASDWDRLQIMVWSGQNMDGKVFKPMLRLDTETDATYEPYKGHKVTVSFGSAGTVYGGTLDVVTGAYYGGTVGTLTVTHGYYLLDGAENWTVAETTSTYNNFRIYKNETFKSFGHGGNGLSNMAVYGRNYTDGKITFRGALGSDSTALYFLVPKTMVADLAAWKSLLGTTNLQMTMELATPQTYNLIAQQVELLTGNNHVWADTGDITLTYGADPYKVINPTLFASKPLLMVTGRGTLSVGDVTLTISGTTSQVLYIDCDIMEVYSITGGQMQPQNSLVTISGNEYPTLQPGATQITLGSGITQVVITPRWWRI